MSKIHRMFLLNYKDSEEYLKKVGNTLRMMRKEYIQFPNSQLYIEKTRAANLISMLESIIYAEKEFRKVCNEADLGTKLAISPHGFPSIPSLKADLEIVEEHTKKKGRKIQRINSLLKDSNFEGINLDSFPIEPIEDYINERYSISEKRGWFKISTIEKGGGSYIFGRGKSLYFKYFHPFIYDVERGTLITKSSIANLKNGLKRPNNPKGFLEFEGLHLLCVSKLDGFKTRFEKDVKDYNTYCMYKDFFDLVSRNEISNEGKLQFMFHYNNFLMTLEIMSSINNIKENLPTMSQQEREEELNKINEFKDISNSYSKEDPLFRLFKKIATRDYKPPLFKPGGYWGR